MHFGVQQNWAGVVALDLHCWVASDVYLTFLNLHWDSVSAVKQ